jgi:very-short-patch-repair endonuclease
VKFADSRAESALESIARVAFRNMGLPPPELQVWVGGDDVVGRADFFWPEHSTIGEADGQLKYSDPSRAVGQLRRDAMLREAGFEVVHFGWYEITQTPSAVAYSIRAAFERAAIQRSAVPQATAGRAG